MLRALASTPAWEPSLNELVSFDNGEASITPALVYGVNGALPLLVALALVLKALSLRRLRREAHRAEAAAALPSAPGDAVICGTARAIDGPSALVEITIAQRGVSKAHKNKKGLVYRHTTTWTEVSRTTSARPFRLETESGAAVRVEPGERIRLLDELEDAGQQGAERRRVARLVDGERVYAFGTLGQEADPRAPGGYRGGGTSSVLRASGTMLLSVGRMSERFARRARVSAWCAAAALAFFLVTQAIALPYHVALWWGHAEPAVVVRVEETRVRNERRYWLVSRRLATGEEREERISDSDRDLFTPGRTIPINVVRFMGTDRVTLGAGATMLAAASVLPIFLGLVLVGIGNYLVKKGRPWYERSTLVEETDGAIE